MSICNSCGGVIGRDCFNPSECAWISESMAQQAAQQSGAQDECIALERRNAELTESAMIDQREIEKAREQRDYAQNQVSELTAGIAELEKRAENISRDEANELQGVLRTLTNSGTALIKSARDLVEAYERSGRECLGTLQQLAEAQADKVRLDKLCAMAESAPGPITGAVDDLNAESEKQGMRVMVVIAPYPATERPKSLREAIDLIDAAMPDAALTPQKP